MRDASRIAVDAGIRYSIASAIGVNGLDNATAIKAGVTAVEAIDKRHQEKFRYYGSDYSFEYEMVRFLASKKRELDIMK